MITETDIAAARAAVAETREALAATEAAYTAAAKARDGAAKAHRNALRLLSAALNQHAHERLVRPVWATPPAAWRTRDYDLRVVSVNETVICICGCRGAMRSNYHRRTGYIYGSRGPAKAEGGKLDVAATMAALEAR